MSSLRLLKSWEGAGAFLVLSVATSGRDPDQERGAQKFYLIVDANQRGFGVRASHEKPEDLKPQGAFANLLRKYVKTGGCGPVLADGANGDVWVPLHTTRSPAPEYYLQLAMGSPPELRLVTAAKEILIRKSSQGTYTKRRVFEGTLPVAEGGGLRPGVEEVDLGGGGNGGGNEHEREQAQGGPERQVQGSGQSEDGGQARGHEGPLLPEMQRAARDRLSRKLKTVRKSLSKMASDKLGAGKTAALEQEAALLKANLFRVREGMFELKVATDAGEAAIALDPERSPGHNLERLYTALKKLRKGQAIGETRLAEGQRDAEAMSQDLERLRQAPLGEGEIIRILTRYKLPLAGPKTEMKGPHAAPTPRAQGWKTYVFAPENEAAIEILVGKSAQDNDELCKQARSNDVWLHAVGVTGSHVIIPARQMHSEPSLALLRTAGVLALHYSRLKADLAGEVYLTKKQHLRKRKGMPAGLWQIDHAESIFVRYDEAELKRVLEMLRA